MTGLEVFCLVTFLIVLGGVGLLLFANGVDVKDFGTGFLGCLGLLLAGCVASAMFFQHGQTFPADDGFPISLDRGVVYRTVASQPVADDKFLVWVEWQDGQRHAIYRLGEVPPSLFTKDSRGNFVALK